MSERIERSEQEAQNSDCLVPGLREIYELFRAQFPELSPESLLGIFRMAVEPVRPSVGQRAFRRGKSPAKGYRQPEAKHEE